MKQTGIVRRIDDLGRVVIPKEIRRSLKIYEGDPMEIFVENGGVLFKKYEVIEGATEAVDNLKNYIAEDADIRSQEKILQKIKEIEDILKEEQAERNK